MRRPLDDAQGTAARCLRSLPSPIAMGTATVAQQAKISRNTAKVLAYPEQIIGDYATNPQEVQVA